jgi:nitrite reductase (NADH) small subunit
MRVLDLADLQPGQPVRVEADGRAILVALVDGVPYAMSDTCPHNGASLVEGVMRDGCITCPAHFWRFSIRDGTKQSDPRIAVPTYRCWIEDGCIEVEVPPAEPVRSMRQVLLDAARQGREPARQGREPARQEQTQIRGKDGSENA